MKKRFLTFLMLALFIIPCVTFCSACFNNSIKVSTFEELSTALSTKENATIKLENDIDATAPLVVSSTITLDLNGHKIYNSTDIWNNTVDIKNWSLISVKKNGNLTITGNGKIMAKENDCYCVDVRELGKVTIKNGEFLGNVSAVYAFKGIITIDGGYFDIQQKDIKNPYAFELNCFDENREIMSARIIVNGGTFKSFNPANCFTEGPNTNFVSQNYKTQYDEVSDSFTVVAK